ncbi:MAG: 23S rRNA (adenine(2030)-N(6))-methyltransferase RlmJ [Pseudomonadaceae bacterium]|nr:23S rRNA (adenine(2030)-N(6))-methyltransferase RlmJ [Pseudomonadaceae bacterium]
MFSYQHAYHAGGPADVVKHAMLSILLERLTAKPKSLTYYETHAGRAAYRLDAPEAIKTNEAAHGIARILPLAAQAPAILSPYLTLQGTPNRYLGSPLLAANLLRGDDALVLCEAHPREHAALADAMAKHANAQVLQADGPAHIPTLLPPATARGLVLIDPAYERQQDYAATASTVAAMLKAWPKAVIMVWYPLLPEGRHVGLVNALENLEIPATLQAELCWRKGKGRGAYGSGQLILNLPYGLEDDLTTALEWLLPHLTADGDDGLLRLGFLHPPR